MIRAVDAHGRFRAVRRFMRNFVQGCVLAGALATFCTGGPVRAQGQSESFEIGLSTDEIGITSDFAGANLVVFGALDNADARVRRQQRYDIVVVLVGPRLPVIVRKKERTFGLWINRGSESFNAAPSSYALASTRPLGDVTGPALRSGLSLGIEDLRFNAGVPVSPVADEGGADEGGAKEPGADEPGLARADPAVVPGVDAAAIEADAKALATGNRDQYATALRRIRSQSGLFNQAMAGVSFVSPTLFRADLTLPADLPVGTHTVRAYLFKEGAFIGQSEKTLTVYKTGFESLIANFAARYGFLYGLFAVALAIFTGWFGRLVFKRD